MSRLDDLYFQHGQSPWIDNIRRDWLNDGTLADLVARGVRGVTSNPSIFAKALSATSAYDDAIRVAHVEGTEDLFEALAVRDVQDACDVLSSVFDSARADVEARRRRHGDGFVSLEVSPHLANDTEGTIEAALRLWKSVDRANAMIKIPATIEGLPAITEVLSHGVNVNVTLIFSVDRYADVIGAWAQGLTRAREAGYELSGIASVASFFVSRVDSAVDAILEKGDPRRGQVANAQVALAYETFQRLTRETSVESLMSAGAQIQRPLWASTSTKNPDYDELLYVEPLVAPETVNTMPDATLEATLEHGDFSDSLLVNQARRAQALELLEGLRGVVDLGEITSRLERDGVAAFKSSYDDVLASVAATRERVAGS